jgi:hypothetical protein
MEHSRAVLVSVALLAAHAPARAEGTALSFKLGTPGLGLELTQRVADTVNARVGFNWFAFDYDGSRSDIDYGFRAEPKSLVAMLDWHPGGGSFRVTAGGLRNWTSLEGTGKPVGSYTIGDTTYSAAEIGELRLRASVPDFAPYFGLGFGNGADGGQVFAAVDLGVIYQGSPTTELTATGPIANTPGFQEDLAAEIRDLDDDLRNYRFYPVLAFGIGIRF